MLDRERIIEALLGISDPSTMGPRSEFIARLLRATLEIVECEGAVALLTLHRTSERTAMTRGAPEPAVTETPRATSELTRLLLRGGHPLALQDLAADARVAMEDRCPDVDSGPALFVPLRFNDHSFGYLAAHRRGGGARFASEEIQALSLLAAWAGMMLQNRRLSESLEKLAVTDDLTQVYNFRFLKTALRREIKRAARFRQQLSLVMIDVDNLKSYNDRNGHMRGSLLLRELAGLFAQNVRSFDLVAKYGGDEFTLILPQTDREGARVVADRMRQVVAEHTFPLAVRGGITVSLGIATFPEDASDPVGLIRASDRTLYAAKKRGRNRVETIIEKAA
jgi:diguanylate cyclase (GGDEF)-like protein